VRPLDANAVAAVGAADPAWLAEARAAAAAYYDKLAMPAAAEETWRYVDLDFAIDDFELAEAPGEAHEVDADIAGVLETRAGSIRVVDGFATEVTSPDGPATLASRAALLAAEPDRLRPYAAASTAADVDKFSAAHHAFGRDGAVLIAPRGTAIAEPFFIDIQAATAGTVSFPRVTLVAEPSAEASVVIRYRSDDQLPALAVPQLEMIVGQNARLKVTIVQHWGRQTSAIASARAVIERDGTLHMGEAGLGGKLSRLHLAIDLPGDGSNVNVVGAYYGDGEQTLDYRYFMDHQGLNTDSDMFLKGAVQDDALSVFTGMIRIEEEAQKTNAFQTNRNLILSDGASAQSVPNLEILANDVRCGHGSTMGPLDEEQRYYLMSRGLDAPRANRLLVHGFFNEALARFPEPSIAAVVTAWIEAKYRAAQEAGRV
jgi:Fe-S cluster assembly protein SufD